MPRNGIRRPGRTFIPCISKSGAKRIRQMRGKRVIEIMSSGIRPDRAERPLVVERAKCIVEAIGADGFGEGEELDGGA